MVGKKLHAEYQIGNYYRVVKEMPVQVFAIKKLADYHPVSEVLLGDSINLILHHFVSADVEK